MNMPTTEAVLDGLAKLTGDPEMHGAALIAAVAVGSWAESRWQAGDDVDVRAVYVLPTQSYLGIGSWWDEIEVVRRGVLELDLVALEIAKAARLALKGHRPTLAWLTAEPVLATDAGRRLAELARQRLAELEGVAPTSPPPRCAPALYQAFDELVRGARLGVV